VRPLPCLGAGRVLLSGRGVSVLPASCFGPDRARAGLPIGRTSRTRPAWFSERAVLVAALSTCRPFCSCALTSLTVVSSGMFSRWQHSDLTKLNDSADSIHLPRLVYMAEMSVPPWPRPRLCLSAFTISACALAVYTPTPSTLEQVRFEWKQVKVVNGGECRGSLPLVANADTLAGVIWRLPASACATFDGRLQMSHPRLAARKAGKKREKKGKKRKKADQ